jgi:DNA helicase-2/ATP-dependent DNA helicase PcrA
MDTSAIGSPAGSLLGSLNEQQRAAATAGSDPLLIIAGAGTGKTNTLAHRVAHPIATGVDPSRILLLTFTRRASAEMLKRVESILASAHVKDALSFLRVAENPRDSTSAFRVLQLIDGVGAGHARRAIAHLRDGGFDLKRWQSFAPPAAASGQWRDFVAMLGRLSHSTMQLPEQIGEVKRFYVPILEKRYDQAPIRKRDLDQLELIASNFRSRSSMLTDLTLDPPASTQDLAGAPLREEDYLILSTIHSAKGCEWDAVYVLHAADGNIPSDMATGDDEDIEEERRLFYVALTRARDFLAVCCPLKYYRKKHATGDAHSYAQVTRFLPESILDRFERISLQPIAASAAKVSVTLPATDIRKKNRVNVVVTPRSQLRRRTRRRTPPPSRTDR